jgi:hypothetical protein
MALGHADTRPRLPGDEWLPTRAAARVLSTEHCMLPSARITPAALSSSAISSNTSRGDFFTAAPAASVANDVLTGLLRTNTLLIRPTVEVVYPPELDSAVDPGIARTVKRPAPKPMCPAKAPCRRRWTVNPVTDFGWPTIPTLKMLCVGWRFRVVSSSCRLLLLNRPSLPQQSYRFPLFRAAKQQRVSQRRALNDLTRPLVVPGKLRAHREICTALNQ